MEKQVENHDEGYKKRNHPTEMDDHPTEETDKTPEKSGKSTEAPSIHLLIDPKNADCDTLSLRSQSLSKSRIALAPPEAPH